MAKARKPRARGLSVRLEQIAEQQAELAAQLEKLPAAGQVADEQREVASVVASLARRLVPGPRVPGSTRGEREQALAEEHAEALRFVALAQHAVAFLASWRLVDVPSEIWKRQYSARDRLLTVARLGDGTFRALTKTPAVMNESLYRAALRALSSLDRSQG